jgi:excisionase family DNA binding protein
LDHAILIFTFHINRLHSNLLIPTMPPERRVVTLSEAATILRISRGSAYEAAKRKEIPTVRIGRRLLVPAAALERMLAGNAAA